MAKEGKMRSREFEVVGVIDPQTGEFSPFERVSVEMGAPVPLREAVREKFTDIEAIGDGIGGAFYLLPLRAEVVVAGVKVWQTVGWKMSWEPYAPAASVPAPQPEPVASPDLETDAVDAGLFTPTAAPEPAAGEPVDFAETDEDDVTPLGAEVDHAWAGR